ncbi:MAG: branched-chain amino acid ABC transporter permease, partial [Chloroflexi bacterium]
MRFVGRAPRRYWLIALGVIVFAGLPTQVTSFQSLEWAEVLIFAIVIMGLNLLIGYSGQISLGHGAFMAVGAYTTAILVHRYHVEYLVTI